MRESSSDKRTGHVDVDTINEDSPAGGCVVALVDSVADAIVGAPQ